MEPKSPSDWQLAYDANDMHMATTSEFQAWIKAIQVDAVEAVRAVGNKISHPHGRESVNASCDGVVRQLEKE